MKSPLLLALVLTLAMDASAVEWHTIGARAIGMGGAGVATAQGPLAEYWNPAALGRQVGNAYGLQVPVGVHAAVLGDVVEGARDLRALRDKGATATQADIDAALTKLNHPGNGLRIGGDFGADTKIGDFAVFLNGYADVGAVPSADLNPARTTPAAIAAGTNNSKLIVKGANVGELGVGYGHELPFAPGLSLGGNLKLMSATVGYADYFILRESNNDNDIVRTLKNGARKSANVGVDLGLLWDLDKSFDGVALKPRIGVTGRNLNNPKFKQPDAAITAGATDKFALNPQVRLGVSLQPFHWWNLAADLDLTRNLTPIDNAASRQLGLGSEFNVFNRSWINIPLRVGLARNLENAASGTMLTAGAGLHFLHVFIDASAGVSNKRVQTQSQGKDQKTPREAMVGFQLSLLFGGTDEPEAPSRQWKSGPSDGQPVPTERVRESSEKAHEDLKVEEVKHAEPEVKPSTTKP